MKKEIQINDNIIVYKMEDRKYSSTFQGVDLDKIEGGVSQSISLKNDQNEDHSTSIKLDAFRTSEW